MAFNPTKKHLFFLFFFFFIVHQNGIFAQSKFTFSGYVKDASTGETMPGVSIADSLNNKQATNTNTYGFFSLTLKAGTYHFVISSLGFESKIIAIVLDKNVVIDFALQTTVYKQKEVVITSEKQDKNISNVEMGSVKIGMDQIKTLPAFMGEVDLMKTLQLMPGVKSAGDGNTGIYVRGGGPDQNLILLDEAVIYNPAHLLGFFSVFNGDAVSNVQLYKGGMPAQYGGRLAAVLDIGMKEGNNKKLQVDGGIGLISSRLTIQGPIKKDTSSFIISARRTYIDVLAQPFIKSTSQFKGSGVYFYDINAKFNYILSSKNRLFLSGYFGRDKFTYQDKPANFKVEMPWGNATAAMRWNHLFNAKLFVNTSIIFSDFKFQFNASQSDFNFKLFSGIRDWNLKSDFNYYPSIRHLIKFGVNYIFHTFTPYNAAASQGDVVFDVGKLTRLYAHEAAIYVSDEFDWTDRLKINVGLRYSMFQQIGPFDRYLRNQIGQRNDTVTYKTGQKVAQYGGFEPRLGIRFSINPSTSVKASYTHNLQYIHMVSLSAVSLPTDVWVPSTELVKPQIGNQYSIGLFKNFRENVFETSVELYYKTMQNQVEYKEGALPEDNLNDNTDYNYTFGKGEAYGVEFFIKKRMGKLNGWIGYTFSYTTRTFPEINQGATFYAKFDRRHDASLVLQYDLSSKWTFSTIFVYGTGNAITLPQSRYFIENRVVNEYGPRNALRLAPYHRLDISATLNPDHEKHLQRKLLRKIKRQVKNNPNLNAESIQIDKSKWYNKVHSSWSFSVFNVYNRQNPYFIYFDNEGNVAQGNLKIKAKQVSLFPALPSITYNFKF